jgi:hypothetical protein
VIRIEEKERKLVERKGNETGGKEMLRYRVRKEIENRKRKKA